jgi:hypothetical protein
MAWGVGKRTMGVEPVQLKREKVPSDLRFAAIRRATGVLLAVRFLGVALCLQTFELASVSFGSWLRVSTVPDVTGS